MIPAPGRQHTWVHQYWIKVGLFRPWHVPRTRDLSVQPSVREPRTVLRACWRRLISSSFRWRPQQVTRSWRSIDAPALVSRATWSRAHCLEDNIAGLACHALMNVTMTSDELFSTTHGTSWDDTQCVPDAKLVKHTRRSLQPNIRKCQ